MRGHYYLAAQFIHGHILVTYTWSFLKEMNSVDVLLGHWESGINKKKKGEQVSDKGAMVSN